MITMIDLDMGNLRSVQEALRRVGCPVQISNRPEDLEAASAVVLPGVGAFGDGMAKLRAYGLVEPLRRHHLVERKPLLGVCVGMQMLAAAGEEFGTHEGLGFLEGRQVRLVPAPDERLPNMGWCDVHARPGARLFDGIPAGASFYFAHSYHVEGLPAEAVAAEIDYGGRPIAVAVEQGTLFGVQFHPEKSQEAGLNLLSNFAALVHEVETA